MFEWIVGIVDRAGYLGVFILMFAENIFPPIPSELIMPLAGFHCARGDMNPVGAVIAGTLGSVAGALPWYWAGRILGKPRIDRLVERHGAFLTIDPPDVDRAEAWLRRHGWSAVFFGRLAPLVRTVISLPAGIARMPLWGFLALTALGSAIWVAALTAAGYVLNSQYERVQHWLDPVTTAIIAGAVALYAFRLVRRFARG